MNSTTTSPRSIRPEKRREGMITMHMGLVHHIARRMARTVAPTAELAELISGGIVGLIQAVDSFDEGRDLAFSTYAAPRIRGAILDELRRSDHATRGTRRRQRQVKRVERELGERHARQPQHAEVARELGVDQETLWTWKASGADAVHVALEERIGGTWLQDVVEGSGAEEIEAPIEQRDRLRWLQARIQRLDERERMVLALYYAQDLKLREIGEVLGVTESRVSQIRTSALSRLRAEWQGELAA